MQRSLLRGSSFGFLESKCGVVFEAIKTLLAGPKTACRYRLLKAIRSLDVYPSTRCGSYHAFMAILRPAMNWRCVLKGAKGGPLEGAKGGPCTRYE